MTDEELRTHLDNEIRNSVGLDTSELSTQRKTALDYFYGEPFGNEMEGRSSYVSPDVRDTILWIMPSLMRIFTGGDHIVRFEPQGPEDEQKANQATDFVNYIFQRQNDGFLTLHTWFMDALMSKNGFTKVYWEESKDTSVEEYDDLDDMEFVMIANDPDVEILEHTEEEENGVKTHDIKLRRSKESEQCRIIPVPPEEILVNKTPNQVLSKNRFIAHRRRVTISELREMGYENVEGLNSYENQDFNTERTARLSFDETDTQDIATTEENKMVWLAECFVKMDLDGDGIAENNTIIMAGDRILEKHEGHTARIVSLTPIPLPHKLFGMSISDLVMDLQLLKSTIFRQILDNMYLANNGRYMALDGMVNIDDLLTSRPGGIVRVKTFDAVKPMQPPLLGAPAFNLLEYVDHIKDVRTGVNKDLQGLDPDTINRTATAQSNRLGAAQSRIELIARIFAETGVKDLFYAILECVQKHQKKATVIKLKNQWVPMDPREWTNKFDLTVSVGLGTGSKDSIIGALLETIKLQMADMQMGLPTVTPVNLYNTRLELLKAQSIKGGDRFFTDPSMVPPKPPQPDPELIKLQAKTQSDQQKLQLKAHDSQMKAQLNLQLDQLRREHEAAMKQMEAAIANNDSRAKEDLERWKAKLEAETRIVVAELSAKTSLKQTAMTTNANRDPLVETQDDGTDAPINPLSQLTDAINQNMAALMQLHTQSHQQIVEHLQKPKQIMRGPDGRVIGVQ